MIINGKSMQQWKDLPSPANFNTHNNINNNNYTPNNNNNNSTPTTTPTNKSHAGKDDDESYSEGLTLPQTRTENKTQALKSLEDLEKSFGRLNLSPRRDKNEQITAVTPTSGEVTIHKKPIASISASGIGRYFHLNCHRYLAYSTIPKADRQNKIPHFQTSMGSSLQQASIEGGFAWEDHITSHYLGGPSNVLTPAESTDPVELQHKTSVQALRDAKPGNYITQSVFLPPRSLWRTLPKDTVQFSRSIPDFLHIQQFGAKRKIVILDAKSTSQAKFSQQVQVAYYYLLLTGIIEEEKIEDLEVSTLGGIWLKNKRDIDYFDIIPVRAILEKFMYGTDNTDLLALLSVPKEFADWHMMPICEGCDFFDVCHAQAQVDNTLSQVAYINKQTRATLLSFRHSFSPLLSTFEPIPLPYESPVSKTGTEIEDLHQLLVGFQVHCIDKFEPPNASMNGPVLASLKVAQPRVQAARNRAVEVTGSVNVDFPTIQEGVSVYISFMGNPETNSHYSWAVHIEDSTAGSEFASGDDIRSFVILLANTFCLVNEANARAPTLSACKSLQCYVFDQYEHSLLIKTLMGLMMEHPDARNENLASSNPFATSLVAVLLALLHSSDWLGFGGSAALPSHAKTMKIPQVKPKPSPAPSSDYNPTKKLDFNDLIIPDSREPLSAASPFPSPRTSSQPPTPRSPSQVSEESSTVILLHPTSTDTPTNPILTETSATPTPAPTLAPVTSSDASVTPVPPLTPSTPQTPVPITPISPPITPSVTSPKTPSVITQPPAKEYWRSLLSCSPAIVVQSLVSTMLALPHFPVYDITACARFVLGKPTEQPIDADAIFREWKKEKKVEGNVEAMLRERLLALRDIVLGLRHPNVIGERQKRPRKFALRSRLQVSNSLVSQMLFTEEYELASACSKIRSERSAPMAVRIQTGKAMRVSVVAKNVSVIIPQRGNPSATYDSYYIFASLDEIYGKIPQPDFAFTFPWLISKNSSEGETGVYQFDDAPFQDGIPAELVHAVGFARVESIEPDSTHGYRIKLRVKVRKNSTILKFLLDSQQSDPDAKMDLIMHERFLVDMMFPTLHQHALDMDELCKMGQPPLLLKLVSGPTEWIQDLPEAEFGQVFLEEAARVTDMFARLHDDLQMHPSQTKVWHKLVANKLQLVLGPPGTGKTHFLALSILILLETHRALGIPFTIGVAAFTHIACEHLLAKISALQRLAKSQFAIIKLGEINTKEALEADITSKEPKQDGILPGSLPLFCVVGGTVWRFRKAFGHHGQVLDALVIDEATQLPVLEASIATQFINESKGRLILAGDHKQLGPIRRGEYPRGNASSLQLHKSIFVCLKSALTSPELKNKHMGTLHENMRMNADLCAFPAAHVYTADYKPFRLASQGPAVDRAPTTPRSMPPRSLSNLVTRIVAQERSMVVVLLPSASDITSFSWESQITALLALELFSETGLPNDSDGHAEFWRRRLFVVTPQHTQRFATRQALVSAGFIADQLFVDTVEKMQGQEAENVIVSYGSCQWAHITSEFVFSRNRLNVCTSRARSRCVVLLLEDLLTPSPAVLDNPTTKKAYYYLLQLVNYAKVYHLSEFL